MQDMHGEEARWTRTLGVLLLVLGLTLFAWPRVSYTTRETAIHTREKDFKVEPQKTLTIPRPVSLAFITAGVVMVMLASRNPHR
jgi:hypothetical protein